MDARSATATCQHHLRQVIVQEQVAPRRISRTAQSTVGPTRLLPATGGGLPSNVLPGRQVGVDPHRPSPCRVVPLARSSVGCQKRLSPWRPSGTRLLSSTGWVRRSGSAQSRLPAREVALRPQAGAACLVSTPRQSSTIPRLQSHWIRLLAVHLQHRSGDGVSPRLRRRLLH